MASELFEILRNHEADPRFGRIVAEALDFLSTSITEREHAPTGRGQSSKSLADLHSFRKRSGYYSGPITGLDETIDALGAGDQLVRLGVIESDRGAIAVWVNESGLLAGLMIVKSNDPLASVSE